MMKGKINVRFCLSYETEILETIDLRSFSDLRKLWSNTLKHFEGLALKGLTFVYNLKRKI